ncbi:MAG: hypothetical protein ABJ308_18840 [Halieaceae bacterium]
MLEVAKAANTALIVSGDASAGVPDEKGGHRQVSTLYSRSIQAE